MLNGWNTFKAYMKSAFKIDNPKLLFTIMGIVAGIVVIAAVIMTLAG